MPLPRIQRGELWLVDLGYLGKTALSSLPVFPFLDHERTLCIVVPHTRSIIGTRFEIDVSHPALDRGVFDVQQTAAVQAAKFIRRLGVLNAVQITRIEAALATVLGLILANE